MTFGGKHDAADERIQVEQYLHFGENLGVWDANFVPLPAQIPKLLFFSTTNDTNTLTSFPIRILMELSR